MAFTPVIARDGNNAAQSMAALQDLAGINYSMVSLDSTRQVYRASASFTPQATAGVTVISIVGSATKTVRVKRILLGGIRNAPVAQLKGVAHRLFSSRLSSENARITSANA